MVQLEYLFYNLSTSFSMAMLITEVKFHGLQSRSIGAILEMNLKYVTYRFKCHIPLFLVCILSNFKEYCVENLKANICSLTFSSYATL